MKKIKLSQEGKNKKLNLVALVNDEDFDWLNQWKWLIKKVRGNTYYVARVVYVDRKGTMIFMHREILGLVDSKIQGDHKDHDTLNNQRNNLRIATMSESNANRRSHKNSTSKYLGVSLSISKYKDKEYKIWKAQICKNGKVKNLGTYKSETDAAIAYNEAAIKLHGEFASLNQIAI